MAQSLTEIMIHIVFSTKNRHPWIQPSASADLHAYLAGTANSMEANVYQVGGVEDHVHIFLSQPKSIGISDLVGKMKSSSSRWIKSLGKDFSGFEWQRGYGAFSISPNHKQQVIHYVANQPEHHKNVSFEEEFRQWLRKYQMQWDERYVWD